MGRTGFDWLRMGLSGGLLWERQWTFKFHKESRLLFDNLNDYRLFRECPAPWLNMYVSNHKHANYSFITVTKINSSL
jgi:hypothetical protein